METPFPLPPFSLRRKSVDVEAKGDEMLGFLRDFFDFDR
jgi:hypothetical protein